MNDNLNFRISSALKDIIGRDLIADDYIAVFELVKNSYDAHADRVDIYFQNINSSDSKIIIKDNGKGMDLNDIQNKWLFLGYSAKRDGTEDNDYRDFINQNRTFAGAKGIGRFSCDRLGKFLYLETVKKQADYKVEKITTNWEKFETNIKKEFIEIPVSHETSNYSKYDLKYGTILEISGLRSTWDRLKLIKLKDSLSKLISPRRSNSSELFKIFIHADEELEKDELLHDYRLKVNGEIQNFIFETLDLKTTKIISKISLDGKLIETELYDGGTKIYYIKEYRNSEILKGIDFTLYYLNKAAKLTFAKKMGLAAKRYGHVFLYKNNFRIYPFGEPFEDPLKIDVRKSRKKYSHIGTGELMGQIEINGTNSELKETSSRGNGLIKNNAYEELEMVFFTILERLEKYVVDVQQWGLSIEDENENQDINERITLLIKQLTGSNQIIDFKYESNFIDILKKSQSSSVEALVSNLKKIAISSVNPELIENTKKLESRFHILRKEKNESDEEAKFQRERSIKALAVLKEKESENLFLRSVKSQDFDEIISFLHHIGISSGIIDNYLTGIFNKIRDGIAINRDELFEILKIVVFENKKIQNISTFATKANFKLYTDAIELNLDEYLKEYISNIIKMTTNDKIQISFVNNKSKPYIGKFRPIELNILIDNFLSNSKKAGASIFEVKLENIDDKTILSIYDNGEGIPKDKIKEIFNYGFTTKLIGTGLGLYHINEITERINAKLSVTSEVNSFTLFKITFK